jgi:hypothetical protein
MQTAIPIPGAIGRLRNFVFLVAVFAMFYTLDKPSPVDVAFAGALGLCPFVNQKITSKFLLLLLLLSAWILSFTYASLPWLGEVDVPFELVQKAFVALMALAACFTAISWGKPQFRTMLKVYVASCAVSSLFGIAGFFTGLELLTWDERAKGFVSDPNMFAASLVPAVVICMYLLRDTSRRLVVMGLLALILLGLMLAFSRAAIVAMIICSGVYLVYINRHQPGRLIMAGIAGILAFGLLLGLLLEFGGKEFSAKFSDRLTVAKSYDLGREGRYARYERALPIILETPRGIGALQVSKIFVEPIHNIWIGAFLSYGWVAGFAWVSVFFLSVAITIRNQRATADPLPIVLFLCFFSAVLCASLHEGEHWRPLWLFMGLIWGYNLKPAAQRVAVREPRYPAGARPAQ